MIPDRLAGWWLASVAGTAAVLVLSPRATADGLRAAVSRLAGTLAEEIDAACLLVRPQSSSTPVSTPSELC